MPKSAFVVTNISSAYGAACARALAAEGYRLVIVDESDAAAKALIEGLGEDAAETPVVIGDPSNKLHVHNIIAEALESYDRIDGLVHIAAYEDDTDFQAYSEDGLRNSVDRALMGSLLINQYVLKQFLKQDKPDEDAAAGVIVNVIQGGLSLAGGIVGASVQSGVEAMSKALAARHAKDGIRTNCVRGGMITGAPVGEAVLKAGKAFLAAGQLGDAQDVASAVTYLASARTQFINGITLDVDGGGFHFAKKHSDLATS